MYRLLQNLSRKILKIRIKTSHEVYPFCNDLKSEEAGIKYLPDSLKILLEELFAATKTGIKVALIGRTIMQATRPRVLLAPLQFGLGVQLYHYFAS